MAEWNRHVKTITVMVGGPGEWQFVIHAEIGGRIHFRSIDTLLCLSCAYLVSQLFTEPHANVRSGA